MEKKELQNNYKNKIKLLINYNKHYYDKNNPIVSDKQYDELKKEILLLEKKFKFLKKLYIEFQCYL